MKSEIIEVMVYICIITKSVLQSNCIKLYHLHNVNCCKLLLIVQNALEIIAFWGVKSEVKFCLLHPKSAERKSGE